MTTLTISYIIHHNNRKFFQEDIQKIRGRFFFYNEWMRYIFEYDQTDKKIFHPIPNTYCTSSGGKTK